jgi:hypothetical protein
MAGTTVPTGFCLLGQQQFPGEEKYSSTSFQVITLAPPGQTPGPYLNVHAPCPQLTDLESI